MKTNHFSLFVVFVAMFMVGSSAKAQTIPKASDPVCAYCGVKLKTGEPHKPGCKYHTGTASSTSSTGTSGYTGSSTKSNVRSNPAFGVADAGISTLGSFLSQLVGSAFESKQSKTTRSSAPKYPVLSEQQLADRKVNVDYWIDKLFEDRDYWEYGDYIIALDGALFSGCGRAITIKNKKTGEYILGPFDSKMADMYKKDKFPPYNLLITQYAYDKDEKNKYKEYGHSGPYNVGHFNAGRIRFFDSSRQGTPRELDGLLFVDGRWSWPNPEGKKGTTQFSHVSGIYKIEENKLKPVLKLDPAPAPFVGERFEILKNYGIFRHCHKAESKWLDETVTPRKEYIINFMMSDFYSLDGKPLRKDVLYFMPSEDSTFLWCLDYSTLGGTLREHHENKRKWTDYPMQAVDRNMNPVPLFKAYDYLSPVNISGRRVVVAGASDHYGVIDEKGRIIIPLMYVDPVQVNAVLDEYGKIGFTSWYKNSVEKLMGTKGEFEKQEHFEARSNDPSLQEAYILEKLGADVEGKYLEEMYKKGVGLSLGKYDSEKECFPVNFRPATWNSFSLPVPIAEAEAFKASFDEIKEAALKGAVYDIRNDAIGIREITFKLPSGKTFTAKVQ